MTKLALAGAVLPMWLWAANARELVNQGMADFVAGHVDASLKSFDEAVRISPDSMPYIWQRGIALYYAGRFSDCRRQFEAHRTVNPNDVENAAWHFLCVARESSAQDARKALLPVGTDERVPMREIYAMFRGETSPASVLNLGSDTDSRFYSHLYTGLFFEATGKPVEASTQIREAADARYASAGYMHDVARVHLALMQRESGSEIWNFDRTDKLGGHTTKVLGSPRIIDAPGGKAVQFNGTSDALFVDVHPLAGAQQFTWELIFRPEHGGGAEQRIFHLQEKGSNNRYLFETRLTGDNWYLDSFALYGKNSKALMRSDRLHPLDKWYHVAMVYDGKVFRNYVNGEMEGSAELALTPPGPGQSSAGVRINLRDYFKGAMLKTRFTRRALTPAEFMKLP